MSSENLEEKFNKIERLASGSKLARLLHDPLRYIQALGYRHLIYPIKKKGKFARARTFFGADIEMLLPAATDIFLLGAKTHDSEIRLTRFLLKNLRPGDTFADVGAHIGYFSLLAAHLTGAAGKVFAFEASRSTFELLKRNTAAFSQIFPFHKAASDANSTLVFHEFPVLFSEYNSLNVNQFENTAWLRRNPPTRIEVAGQRLDDFFAEKNVVPDLLKIDVEGAELQVLRGMEKLLKTHSPMLVMEYILEKPQNEAHRAALAFAEELGYQAFLIDKDGFVSPAGNLEEGIAAKRLVSENVILIGEKAWWQIITLHNDTSDRTFPHQKAKIA